MTLVKLFNLAFLFVYKIRLAESTFHLFNEIIFTKCFINTEINFVKILLLPSIFSRGRQKSQTCVIAFHKITLSQSCKLIPRLSFPPLPSVCTCLYLLNPFYSLSSQCFSRVCLNALVASSSVSEALREAFSHAVMHALYVQRNSEFCCSYLAPMELSKGRRWVEDLGR